MSSRKVTILGAGHVGSHVALSLAYEHAADEIVLVDKVPHKADAQALDIFDTMSFQPHEVVVRGGDYADVEDSDVVVCAIGEARKPGQNRVDMLDDSIVMCNELIASLAPYKIPGIWVSITNPCDVIVDYMRKKLNLADNRCFGTGTLLDTARLYRVLSARTGVARSAITCFVMGEHGESSMIPTSLIHIGPKPYSDYHLEDSVVLQEVRQGGWIIVDGKKCTEFGIGRACCEMVNAILRDERKILPASVELRGEYGENNVQIGVPCVIGANGIEKIIEAPLTEKEMERFHHSCDVVRGNIAVAAKKGAQ